MVNNVSVLFFFKEISINGNKVKNKSRYYDEPGKQKKKSAIGKGYSRFLS